MTNNDMNDIDIDNDGDFEKEAPQKASLKDTWESNPALKIAAVVLGGAVLVGAYMTFMGGDDAVVETRVQGPNVNVEAKAGEKTEDLAYNEQLKKQDEAALQEAAATGGSHIPVLQGEVTASGIQLPETGGEQQANPLDEWRKRAETRRFEMEKDVMEEEEAPQAEVIPVVAPVRPQQTMKADPAVSQRLSEQMRVIITAQAPVRMQTSSITPVNSEYVTMLEEQKKLEQEAQTKAGSSKASGSGASSGSGGDGKDKPKVIVAAGSIIYAQLLNELNSDVDGPALAQILSGPFRGGRALGTFEKQEEYLTLSFKRFVKQGVVYNVDGIALDEETTLPAHQTDVDHHYWSRIILPAAASFIQGYAQAVAETGTSTTTTAGGGVATEEPEPDEKEELLKGVENAASTIGSVFQENASKEITVIVAKGTTMGILLMDSVTTEDAE